MDHSASTATKDAARTWRRRSCTPPRFFSTLPPRAMARITRSRRPPVSAASPGSSATFELPVGEASRPDLGSESRHTSTVRYVTVPIHFPAGNTMQS